MITKRKNCTQSGFPKQSMMRCFLLTILFMLVVSPAWALTAYYVDPDWGGPETGAAATPWRSLAAPGAWTTINTRLATDDVVVYHSARNAGSDTNQASTVQIGINRTDTSTHRLTLDGISKYNTNDSAPAWAPYVTPSPSNYRSASKFQITANTPIQSAASASKTHCENYFTIQGFRLIYTGSGGQTANLSYLGNLIFQYNEGSKVADGGVGGPGIFVGAASSPSCAVDHVTVQDNFIHDTFGECIYVGTGTGNGDPPGPQGTVAHGDDYLIQRNVITDCNRSGQDPNNGGGQGDGIDVKDGHTRLRIVNNVLTWPHLNGKLYDTGAGCDCSGIIVEGADLIDGNYVESPQKNGIYGGTAYANTVGRSSGLIIQNNIVVNITQSPANHQHAFEWEGASSATYQWSGVQFYNNHVYRTNQACIKLGVPQGPVTVENNILHSCGINGVEVGTGILATHDYNDFFNIVSGSAVVTGSASTSCANIATAEAHSICADPKFVNTSSPYTANNFKLQSDSPAIGTGKDLSAKFGHDYAAMTRTAPWDRGAFNALSSGTITPSATPPAPTNLSVH